MKHATFRPRLTQGALLLFMLGSGMAQAADALPVIQQQWAVCQYQQTGKAKESCLEQLSSEADQASAKEAFRTDLLIWSAIVKSTWAGAKGAGCARSGQGGQGQAGDRPQAGPQGTGRLRLHQPGLALLSGAGLAGGVWR